MEERATVAVRSFEGLFERALPSTPELRAALKAAGYDHDAPAHSYPPRIWFEARRAAIPIVYPGVSEDEGFRRLGIAFVEGFAKTIVGTVMASAAAFLGPERVLARVPWYMRAAREDVRVQMDALTDRRWRGTFEETWGAPHFTAGAVVGMLALTEVTATAEVAERSGDRFVVDIAW